MSFTNLVLGGNWGPDEWPECVEVSHGSGEIAKRYVPEQREFLTEILRTPEGSLRYLTVDDVKPMETPEGESNWYAEAMKEIRQGGGEE